MPLYHAAIDATDALDAEPLRLSDLDGVPLDFESSLFSDAAAAASSAQDFEFVFDDLESSLGNLRFDDGAAHPAVTARARRMPDQVESKRRRCEVGAVDFDPPVVRSARLPEEEEDEGVPDDDAMSAETHSYASHATQGVQPYTEEQYTAALANLAESMKRTEESRRQVMKQRAMFSEQQRRELSLARERMEEQQAQKQKEEAMQSSVLAMFSGSNILEGRKQLSAYVGQLGRQML